MILYHRAVPRHIRARDEACQNVVSLRLVHNSAVSLAASLHIVRVHARCRPGGVAALVRLLSTVKVDVLEVKGVQVAWDVSEKGQADVDEQV